MEREEVDARLAEEHGEDGVASEDSGKRHVSPTAVPLYGMSPAP